MGISRNSFGVCLLLVFLIISAVYSNSFFVSAQTEGEQKSWFSGFIDFFKSIFDAIFPINSEIVENISLNESTNLSVSEKINLSENFETYLNETGAEGNLTIGINNLTNASNITCGECQYIENHECVSYECCEDSECGVNESCVLNACVSSIKECSRICDDRANWTVDFCNKSSGLCEYIRIVPYCGNLECEISAGENASICPVDCTGVSEALYCEQDSDCVPCCAYFRLLDNGDYEVAGRNPYGQCVNKDYTNKDVPNLCDKNTCQGVYGACIECNKCVNHQCVTSGAPCPGMG